MIYFIESGPGGPIKIGVADYPVRRLADLQVGNPQELRLLLSDSGGDLEEKQLHRRFRAWRIRGEWFARCAPIVDYIESRRAEQVQRTFPKRKGMAEERRAWQRKQQLRFFGCCFGDRCSGSPTEDAGCVDLRYRRTNRKRRLKATPSQLLGFKPVEPIKPKHRRSA